MRRAFCRLIPQNFNDSMAAVLFVGIPVLWLYAGKAAIDYPRDATVAIWTLVAYFYYRKAAPERTKDPCPTCGGTGIKS